VRTILWLAPLAAVAGVSLLLFAFQRRLIYFPERSSEPDAMARASRLGLEPWRAGDGSLRGWRAAPRGALRARVLVLHGNAGSALDRGYYPEALAPRGLTVAILEYPGYGARAGSPSEPSLAAAAVEAVEALAAEGPEPVWLVGESLGSGVAARAARLRPAAVRGVFLVTPFARLADVARHHYPFLGFLLRDRWAPAEDLEGYRGNVAVLVAGRDEVVTADQGRRLFAELQSTKRLWEQPEATHNGLDLAPASPWWDEVVAFLAGAPR
jgi:alpha-beta hydrolase superfamily lysophospholipase